MHIIVGLGNPGPDYAHTRHNMGYLALDILAARHQLEFSRKKFKGVCAEGHIGGKKALLLKPETYMNLSGLSVLEACGFYKTEHSELIVIYDDVDIASGCIRIRENGSAGTHNGMRDIIYRLGWDDFPRVRIGVGKPELGELRHHVLTVPPMQEQKILLEALKNAAHAAELITAGEAAKAQALYNKKPTKEN